MATSPTESTGPKWLATINSSQFNWDAYRDGMTTQPVIRWSGPGNEIRENLRAARDGERVVVARFDAGREGIVALGHIQGESIAEKRPDRGVSQAVNIVIDLIFNPVPMASLVEAVPGLDQIVRHETTIFTALSEEQWSYIRPLLLHFNPGRLGPDSIPGSGFDVVNKAEIVGIIMPPKNNLNAVSWITLRVRNDGNTTWRMGEEFLITCRWSKGKHATPTVPESSDKAIISLKQWRRKLDTGADIPPGFTWEIQELDLPPPDSPDITEGFYTTEWQVEGEFEEAAPAIARQDVYLEIPAKPVESPDNEDNFSEGRRLADSESQLEEVVSPVGGYESPSEEMPVNRLSEQLPPLPAKAPAQMNVSPPSGARLPDPPPRVIVVPAIAYEPPPADHKVGIDVTGSKVTLEYGKKKYIGPCKIDREELLSLQTSSPTEYGEALFRSIIHDEGMLMGGGQGNTTLRGYAAAVNDVDGQGSLRFELSLDPAALNDGSLHEIWWEYLKDPEADTPISVYSQSPFYRRQGSTNNAAAADARPLKILVAICNPKTLGQPGDLSALSPIEVDQERDIIERALARLKNAGLAVYRIWDGETGPPVTLANLQQELEEGYHVLHLVAHGAYTGGEEDFRLVMEDDHRGHDLVPAGKFKKPLLSKDLKLVVLASCQSGEYRVGKRLQALGPRLTDLGVPAVVAMQDYAPVPLAQRFTQHFYDDLARCGRVDMAMAATRFALYSHYGQDAREWAIPVLLMSTDDGNLFNIDQKRAENLEKLVPEIRSYSRFEGGDREAMRTAAVLAEEARGMGAGEALADRIREMVAGELLERPASVPLAPRQDRGVITDRIRKLVNIDPMELKGYIKLTHGLEFPDSIHHQLAASLNAGKHVIFLGPPGTGKTTLAHAVCRFAIEQGFTAGMTPTTATADWSTFETTGGYVPTQRQTLQFRPGIFTRSICEGNWLVIDEINRAEIDKAFGELFTVLSGQAVDLPYMIGDRQVRILPPAGGKLDSWWDPALGETSFDYVIHPNWRILASMNSYDKSYLYSISLAFMRRFAFIDLGLPSPGQYGELISRWISEVDWQAGQDRIDGLLAALSAFVDQDSALMKLRAIGPAIIRDVVRHIGKRHLHDRAADLRSLLCEGILLHAAPQFDGLEREGIFEVYQRLGELFDEHRQDLALLRARIKLLYPHIPSGDWP